MKIWIISDLHFGKHNLDSDRWLNNMKSYFYDFFIPFLLEYKKEDDKLFILGDIFDNRNSLNLKVIQTVIELFEKLGSIIDCHILLGNHDMYAMIDPTINSVTTIRNIPGIKVYEKAERINIDGLSILMMPWVHGKDNEKEILEKYTGTDLLFCHSDLNGCRTQLYPTRPASRSILDIDDFAGYGKVYSGHIHIVQTINNFTFVGSPYHLDRNDVANRKGIFIYDTKKRKDVFIENDFSPEFIKVKIDDEKSFNELQDLLKTNNFIDVEISNNFLLNNPHIRLELDKLSNKYKIENLIFINDIEDDSTRKKINTYTSNKSIKDVSLEWVDNTKINIDTDLFTEIEMKNKMKETIEQCFSLLELNKK